MFTKFAAILALSTSALLTTTANAGTILPPIRYQFGQYNEVFYGGANPALTSGNYLYLPAVLQHAYAAQRQNTPILPGISPYQPYGPSGPYVSPYSPDGTFRSTNTPYLYSDYLPNLEVGQFGYTINDVHNEAYQNAPRIQTGLPRRLSRPAAPLPSPSPAVSSDPKSKAIPLINWAKAERTRNPELYQALLAEAAKYDPAAVTKARKDFESKK